MQGNQMCRLIALFVASTWIGAQAQPGSTAGTIYKQAAPAVVSIEAYNEQGKVGWSGTGFIVAADGKILTNYHVIRNSKQATVRLANGDAYDSVEVLDVDNRKDIALLKIKAVDLPVLRVGSSASVQVGDTVYSLSNPLGVFDNTLSQGIISGNRQMDGYRLLQTTAPISHGSSGGPLFNSSGEVIGITNGTNDEGQNLNFAIPIDYARGMLASPNSPKSLASVYSPEKAPEPPPPPAALEPKVTREALTGTTVDGEIYAFPDPTNAMREFELNFGKSTGRLRAVYAYPYRATLKEAQALWGRNYKETKNPNRTRMYMYQNRRLIVLTDKDDVVISLGVYPP